VSLKNKNKTKPSLPSVEKPDLYYVDDFSAGLTATMVSNEGKLIDSVAGLSGDAAD
jgi:hypothetical protein